jgi:hypothetical protein
VHLVTSSQEYPTNMRLCRLVCLRKPFYLSGCIVRACFPRLYHQPTPTLRLSTVRSRRNSRFRAGRKPHVTIGFRDRNFLAFLGLFAGKPRNSRNRAKFHDRVPGLQIAGNHTMVPWHFSETAGLDQRLPG